MVRAGLYVDEGLPLEKVCSTLEIRKPTYYRRIREALRQDTLLHAGEALKELQKIMRSTVRA
jgi:hypothetical protein